LAAKKPKPKRKVVKLILVPQQAPQQAQEPDVRCAAAKCPHCVANEAKMNVGVWVSPETVARIEKEWADRGLFQ